MFRGRRPANMPHASSAPPAVGKAYEAASPVRPLVEDVRMRVRGKAAAPFRRDNTGTQAAHEWLFAQEATVRENGLDRYPAAMRLEVQLVSPRVRDWWHEVHRESHNERRAAVSDSVRREASSVQWVRTYGGNDGNLFPRIDVTQGNGDPKRYVAPEGTSLGMLLDGVWHVTPESGWWSEREAADHIIFGTVPSGSVATTMKMRWGNSDIVEEIVPRIRAPTTREEVAEAFDAVLEDYELAPARIGDVNNAVLQLVSKTQN